MEIELESPNELQCPKCGSKLKMIGRSGFCKNKKCTIYEIFIHDRIKKDPKAFEKLMILCKRPMKMSEEECKIKHLCPTQFCDTCKDMDKYEFETELYMIVGNAKATRNPKYPHFYTIGKTFGRLCDRCNNDDWQIWCSHEPPKKWHWAKGWSLVKVKVTGVIKNPDKDKLQSKGLK